MGNERLRAAISAAGQTYESLATQLGVDPKTVERWITDETRLPHRRHRWRTAELLGRDEAHLWPIILNEARTLAASEAELIRVYPSRGAVPPQMWRSFLDEARESVDLLAYAALFLPDTNPDIAAGLAERGANGVRVRILLGRPDSAAVKMRAREEGLGRSLTERVRLTLGYLQPLQGAPGVEVRLHATTLYNTILRSDGSMLVNTHIYGSPAAQNPVMHLQRIPGGRMFDSYQRSFDAVWSQGSPVSAQRPQAGKASA